MTIKDLLMEELENKKSFDATWESECDLCGEILLEGDTFYFFGSKRKVCSNCYDQIGDQLEEQLT